MPRDFNHDILDLIKARWSPRAFSAEPVAMPELLALCEAARYAPSCFNEQPWRFILATTPDELAKMQSILAESNLEWAQHAPALLLILAKKTFSETGQDNYWHMFDAGTAWGYLSLEAQSRGLITHGMGGFSKKKAQELYQLPSDLAPMAVIAIGKLGQRDNLPEPLQAREHPGERANLESLFLKQ
ncbi:MAG: nitroreductase family protein [Firmicutes bacterium]|nr:nitroreductase family protein [Dethiobacter sp.]MBS3887857.1 nitroreductase family protein [Bacillota bacterium]